MGASRPLGRRCMLAALAAVSWFAPRAVTAQAEAADPEHQPLAAVTTLDRGATCLDSEKLLEHVATWLGTDRVAAPLAIEVHGSPYFARTVWIRIRRAGATVAERRFDPAPARCDDLHAAVGLAIALALKASLLDSLIGTQPSGDAGETRALRVAAQALGGFAVVPGVDLGLAASLQYTFAERLAARLSFLGLLGPRGDFQDDEGRFETWLVAGRVDVCSRSSPLRPNTSYTR